MKKLVMLCAALVFGLAIGKGVWAQSEPAAQVQFGSDGLTVNVGAVANFDAMNVRIAGPEDNLLLDVQSMGEPVFWSLSASALDGLYRYEVVVLTYDRDADIGIDESTGEGLIREYGSFEVEGGIVMPPELEDDQSSLWQDAVRFAGDVATYVLDAIIPSAHAQNLTAWNEVPIISFFDTSGTPFVGRAALIQTNVPNLADMDRFHLEIQGRSISVKVIDIDTDSDGDQSIAIDLAGDIQLANGAMFFNRNAKTGFAPVDEEKVLAKLATLPISWWQYKADKKGVTHMGPMAEDFREVFGFGNGKRIEPVDADGVALAAIKGLYKIIQHKDAEIAVLEERMAAIERQQARLTSLLDALASDAKAP